MKEDHNMSKSKKPKIGKIFFVSIHNFIISYKFKNMKVF